MVCSLISALLRAEKPTLHAPESVRINVADEQWESYSQLWFETALEILRRLDNCLTREEIRQVIDEMIVPLKSGSFDRPLMYFIRKAQKKVDIYARERRNGPMAA